MYFITFNNHFLRYVKKKVNTLITQSGPRDVFEGSYKETIYVHTKHQHTNILVMFILSFAKATVNL